MTEDKFKDFRNVKRMIPPSKEQVREALDSFEEMKKRFGAAAASTIMYTIAFPGNDEDAKRFLLEQIRMHNLHFMDDSIDQIIDLRRGTV